MSGGAGQERVFLVGMMGAGKSTVAALLAARLGWAAVDTDEVVERRAGMSIAEMFSRLGEAAFREEEERAVAEVGGFARPAGGLRRRGRRAQRCQRSVLQRAGTVVWLRAKAVTLVARVGDGRGRPLLSGAGASPAGVVGGERAGGGPREAFERLVADRQGFYKEVANAVVDVDDLSPLETAQLVLAALGGPSRRRRGRAIVRRPPRGAPVGLEVHCGR